MSIFVFHNEISSWGGETVYVAAKDTGEAWEKLRKYIEDETTAPLPNSTKEFSLTEQNEDGIAYDIQG